MNARPSMVILDDDSTLRAVMAAELDRIEFDLSTAATADEALKKVAESLAALRELLRTSGLGSVRAASVPTLRQTEREQIALALAATSGRRAPAARLLGISERTLYRKIRTHDIEA